MSGLQELDKKDKERKKKNNESAKRYRRDNLEKCLERERKFRENNKEKRNRYSKLYREKNPQKVRELQEKRYSDNPEKERARVAEWRRLNPEKIYRYRKANPEKLKKSNADSSKKWAEGNADKVKQMSLTWRTQNPSKVKAGHLRRRALEKGAEGAIYSTSKKLQWRIQMFSGRCWMCGSKASAIDHVKPLSKGGSHWPSNLRPACGSCNSRKGARWPYNTSITKSEKIP